MGIAPNATLLLQRYGEGDRAAADELLPMLYEELRRIAGAHLAHERKDHTLQPTALVHEAWLRLVDQPARDLQSRQHFLSLAARVMRRVLVDHAREHGAQKRGGDATRVTLDGAVALYESRALDLIALNDALEALTSLDPELARLVELRFFAGCSVEEVAQVLGVSESTVAREWRLARAWLQDQLGDAAPDAS
jgi:RNA polymerase sigma factor (TIGR02999 family)